MGWARILFFVTLLSQLECVFNLHNKLLWPIVKLVRYPSRARLFQFTQPGEMDSLIGLGEGIRTKNLNSPCVRQSTPPTTAPFLVSLEALCFATRERWHWSPWVLWAECAASAASQGVHLLFHDGSGDKRIAMRGIQLLSSFTCPQLLCCVAFYQGSSTAPLS